MIQRIQSIFLLLVSASLILFIILPVWLKADMESGHFYRVFSLYLVEVPGKDAIPVYTFFPYVLSGGIAVLAAVLAIFEIFSYKNRLTQVKIGMINSILILVALGLIIYLTYQNQKSILPDIMGTYQLGLFMPAIALIFNSLANRFIRKDEALIRSVDRIR